jgi:hypothetical protein
MGPAIVSRVGDAERYLAGYEAGWQEVLGWFAERANAPGLGRPRSSTIAARYSLPINDYPTTESFAAAPETFGSMVEGVEPRLIRRPTP